MRLRRALWIVCVAAGCATASVSAEEERAQPKPAPPVAPAQAYPGHTPGTSGEQPEILTEGPELAAGSNQADLASLVTSAAKEVTSDNAPDHWAPSAPSPASSTPSPPSRDMIEAARAGKVDGPRMTGPTRPASAPVPVVKGSDPQSRARAQRMLVYTADLVMAVYDVAGSLDAIERLAGELGGFLASREDRSILIRVPAERFAEAMERLRPLGDILHRAVSVEDVKDAYVDLETRLRNARATRDRIERLLAQTSNVGEILQIEQQLRRITDEIESLEGKIKGIRDRVAFASIRVVFQPRGREDVKKGPFELPFRWLDRLGLSRLLELR